MLTACFKSNGKLASIAHKDKPSPAATASADESAAASSESSSDSSSDSSSSSSDSDDDGPSARVVLINNHQDGCDATMTSPHGKELEDDGRSVPVGTTIKACRGDNCRVVHVVTQYPDEQDVRINCD